MSGDQQGQRAVWADNSKFLAIFLVFFGHILESFYDHGRDDMLLPIKFCHSFFIPIFFILVGIFAKPKVATLKETVFRLFPRRIIPVIFFTVLLLPIHFILPSDTQIIKENPLHIVVLYLMGAPVLNWTTWFLVTLFTAEIIFQQLTNRVKNTAGLIILSLMIYSLGWIISAKSHVLIYLLSGFWFIREAFVAVFFILIGYLIRDYLFKLMQQRLAIISSACLLCLAVTLITFDLNSFINKHVLDSRDTVVMSVSQHGDFFLFPVTALSGSLFIMLLSCLIPSNRLMNYFGKNTLVLLGMAGFFLHFINARLLDFFPTDLNSILLVLLALGLTLVQIIICWPMIAGLNRFTPTLIGQWPKSISKSKPKPLDEKRRAQ